MNRVDLQELSTVRFQEAKSLFAAGHASGAYYLAGYAIECALKAAIAGQTQQHDFPDKQRVLKSWVHDLKELIKTANLKGELDLAMKTDAQLARNWAFVTGWSEDSRYLLNDDETAQDMLVAVGDPEHGVLPWIIQYW